MAGQHRAGKHTAKAQAAAKKNPRIPKTEASLLKDTFVKREVGAKTVILHVPDKKTGVFGKLFGKK